MLRRMDAPESRLAAPLGELLRRRRMGRDYAPGPITAGELDALLWAAYGETGWRGRGTTPSAGGMHPLAFAVAAADVDGLATGGHRADDALALRRCSTDDLRPALEAAAIGDQPWLLAAAAVLVIAGDAPAMLDHFAFQGQGGERGLRYLHVEAGHAAQNVLLSAVALDLAAVEVGGFVDADLPLGALGLEGLQPLLLLGVGRPAPAA